MRQKILDIAWDATFGGNMQSRVAGRNQFLIRIGAGNSAQRIN